MISDIFGGIDYSDRQKLFVIGFTVLCCVMAVALFCAMFFTVKYFLRKSKMQAVKDRQNVQNITKAIRRKKRLIAFFITGFCVSLSLVVLAFVLYMVWDIDIFEFFPDWLFVINIIVLFFCFIAVFGGVSTSSSREPSAISNLKRQIEELNRLKDSMGNR